MPKELRKSLFATLQEYVQWGVSKFRTEKRDLKSVSRLWHWPFMCHYWHVTLTEEGSPDCSFESHVASYAGNNMIHNSVLTIMTIILVMRVKSDSNIQCLLCVRHYGYMLKYITYQLL